MERERAIRVLAPVAAHSFFLSFFSPFSLFFSNWMESSIAGLLLHVCCCFVFFFVMQTIGGFLKNKRNGRIKLKSSSSYGVLCSLMEIIQRWRSEPPYSPFPSNPFDCRWISPPHFFYTRIILIHRLGLFFSPFYSLSLFGRHTCP